MSRVGKMPITVPQGVDVSVGAEQISVKGVQGTLTRKLNALVAGARIVRAELAKTAARRKSMR